MGGDEGSSTATTGYEHQRPQVLILVQSPTQWQTPLFRYLERCNGISLAVGYFSAHVAIDPELGRPPGWNEDMISGYASERLPKTLRGWLLWLARRGRRPDLIVMPGWHHGWCRLILAAGLMMPRLGHRLVVFTDTTRLTERRWWKSAIRRTALRTIRHGGIRFAVPGSLAAEDLHLLGLPPGSLARLPYAVDNDLFAAARQEEPGVRESQRQQWGIGGAQTVLLCVAKFCERETPLDVIEAFLRLEMRFPDARLVLVGDGPQRELVSLAACASGSNRIILAGYVPYHELPRVFAAADVFIHFPITEPWGLSVNEAAASYLPIITSGNVGAGFDLVVNGENGFVVDHSVVGIETALVKILSVPVDDRRRMGLCSAKLSEKVHYRNWLTTLEELATAL